jgi:hypothetical protein
MLTKLCTGPVSTWEELVRIAFAIVAVLVVALSVKLASTLFRRDHPLDARMPRSTRFLASIFGFALGAGWMAVTVYVQVYCR